LGTWDFQTGTENLDYGGRRTSRQGIRQGSRSSRAIASLDPKSKSSRAGNRLGEAIAATFPFRIKPTAIEATFGIVV
jgi:hypothetical protein